jgi:hypothetical protein
MAGLGYKNFNTGDVLTAGDVDNYLMEQTVMVFADAAARTSALTAVLAEGMISYLKDTNATQYYSGSAWVNIGASGGGMTLLSTTTLSGASTTISSIDQTYIDLQVVIYGTTNASAAYYPYFKPNGTSNLADYSQLNNNNGTPVSQAQINADFAMNYGLRNQTDANNFFNITIDNYASTTIKKTFISSGAQINNTSTQETILTQGLFDTTSAITSLVISTSAGTYNAGTVLIYGVK